jgi:pimeloyl-ACP methyl ester carboxylesterase
VPSTYVIGDRDNAIPVPAQEAMSARAGTTHRLESDHSPFLSDPDAVADLIRAAAP